MTDSAAGTRAISSVPDGMGFGTSPTRTQETGVLTCALSRFLV
jgi:hypothetical protein